jgi:RNA polymerase sigma-70 factor (family 1)
MAERSKQKNEQDLIRKLQEGAEQAFAEIFREWYAPLVLNAYRITDNQQAAEDIAEEAFVKLWEKRNSFKEIQSLKSYLYTMTRNASLTWLRKNKSETTRDKKAMASDRVSDPTPLENMIYHEMMTGIYAVINKLPSQCRKVFTMHYIEGKKISEIALELNISVGTVNTHKFRGIRLLQKALLGSLICLLIGNS